MPGTTYWQSWRIAIRFFANVCLAFLFACYLLPLNASAQIRASGPAGLTLQVNTGFHTRYRNDNWIPVQILARNLGSDFTGTLSISASNLQPVALPALYQEPIALPHGAQKEVAFSLPLYLEASGTQSLLVKLLDSSGNAVLSQVSALSAVGPQDVFVGILSDQPSGFEMLRAISVPGQEGSVITEPLDASTFPSTAAVLRNFNLIVLDDFTTSSLSRSQLLALESWVNQGGVLIEVGGPEWQRTLSALPADLLPVHIDGTSMLPANTSFVPIDGPGTQPAVPRQPQGTAPTVTVSTATIANGREQGQPQGIAPTGPASQAETILSAGDIPLLVQAHRGQGIVCYLAFDPTLEPLVSWAGTSTIWKALLIRGVGDQLWAAASAAPTGPDARFGTSGSAMMGMLQTLLPNALVSPWVLVLLLLAYLLTLGLARSYIIWRYGGKDARRRMDWSWRIVLISIVVFSLLTYGLALNQKGRAIVSSSISIIQLNEGSASAHITTYLSIFVPNQGDFSVHLPGNTVAQPLPSNFLQPDITFSGQATTISSDSDGTDIRLRGVDIWTLRTILAEQDRQIHGGIISHLMLQDGKLTGTLTNRLGYDLNDVYILFPGGFVRIVHVPTGQTQHISLLLNTSKTDPNMTLADQIALSNKLPIPYTISLNVAQPQNETQRHSAILNALSSEGYCSGSGKCRPLPSPVLSLKTPSLLTPGPNAYKVHGIDPLLLPGQAATLLGWEDIQGQPVDAMDGVTVNGITPGGTHETLIQAPLNVTFQETQQTLTPATFIPGQVVDVQADKVDLEGSSLYALSNGSMTFEFEVPNSINAQAISTMTLVESLAKRRGFIAEQDTGQFATYLYNWQMGTWDAIPLSIFTYVVQDPQDYIGPGGRVLLECENLDPSQGPLLFNRPSLSIANS